MTNLFRRTWSRASFALLKPLIALCVAFMCVCHLSAAASSLAVSASNRFDPEPDFKVTTVLLIRHAEKETSSSSDDPPLSEAGKARAQSLIHVAGKSGIKAIYTTKYLRTRQTAEPLAKHLGLTSIAMPIKMDGSNPPKISQQSLKEITGKILEHSGQTVLIVGHSNTVPDIIKALGVDGPPSIDEKEFDDLFIVTIYSKGSARVTHLKYGSAS